MSPMMRLLFFCLAWLVFGVILMLAAPFATLLMEKYWAWFHKRFGG